MIILYRVMRLFLAAGLLVAIVSSAAPQATGSYVLLGGCDCAWAGEARPCELDSHGERSGVRAEGKNLEAGGHTTRRTGGQQFHLVDLGTLGGRSSRAFGINNSGQVVGYSELPAEPRRAFLWSARTGMVDLGTLGGDISEAFAINSIGHVVGVSENESSSRRAFLWTQDAGMKDLGTLGGSYSVATSINDLDVVVGISETQGGAARPFVWSQDAGMRDLETLDGARAVPADLNVGKVVGWTSGVRSSSTFTRIFVWRAPTEPTVISSTMGGDVVFAGDVNDAGEIVGAGQTDSGSLHAFLFTVDGTLIDLGTLGGRTSSARGINDVGLIVGGSLTRSGVEHAVLWMPVLEAESAREEPSWWWSTMARVIGSAKDEVVRAVLCDKLRAAHRRVERGDGLQAARILRALGNTARAFLNRRVLSEATATSLELTIATVADSLSSR